jgi:glutathione S-transferase
MITVHHLNNSRSQRVLWLLEELGVPYELVKYERGSDGLAPASLQKIHPLGKSPVVTDSTNGGTRTIAESGAILEYLVETHGGGKLAPARGTPDHDLYLYFMHYAEGSLMPYLLLKLIFGRMRSAKMPFFVKPIAKKIAGTVETQFIHPNLERHIKFIGDHLASHTWFAGNELTAADVQMSFPMEAAAARMPGVPESIVKFVERVHARPAYQRALERGGPYSIMD